MRNLSLSAIAALALTMTPALAATVVVDSITGTWDNVTGATVSGAGTDTISWGTSTGEGQSQYVFDATAVPITDPTSPFQLGTFTHNNNPIFPPSITGAELTVSVSGNVDGNAFTIGGTYAFSHNETTNSAPCFEGSVSVCDDIVTLLGATEFDGSVIVDGEEFFFALTGFEGGASFFTQEGQSNSAALFAGFTTNPVVVNPVPLPAGAILLGTGIAAFGVWSRKNKRKAA